MQISGSLAVLKVTATNQGHYKGPSGAFVTYCNISVFFTVDNITFIYFRFALNSLLRKKKIIFYLFSVLGYRMPAPSNTPESVYKIMLKCWDYNPQSRITFKDLHKQLKSLAEKPPKDENWN